MTNSLRHRKLKQEKIIFLRFQFLKPKFRLKISTSSGPSNELIIENLTEIYLIYIYVHSEPIRDPEMVKLCQKLMILWGRHQISNLVIDRKLTPYHLLWLGINVIIPTET